MPQTLLALLALVGVSLMVLQTGQHRKQKASDIYVDSAISQASGVGLSVLERLSGYPYDGREGGTPLGSGVERFSPRGSFGVGGATVGADLDALFSASSRDDLDDFDGIVDAVARQSVTNPETGAVEEVLFDVSITVDYVARDAAGDWQRVTDFSIREDHKLVTVSVDYEAFPVPLTFGRIYAAP